MDEELKRTLETMQAETLRRFDEMRRHFDVVAEHLESKIETVAEGVVACNERIDRTNQKVDDLSATMEREFHDVRSLIKFSHHELDVRVRVLESKH